MVLLDADIAGHVITWLETRGALDAARLVDLRVLATDLKCVQPELTDEHEKVYASRLVRLARAAGA